MSQLELTYTSGTTGETISLESDGIILGRALPLRGWTWSYTLGSHGVSGLARSAREAKAPLTATSPAGLDQLRRLADRDLYAQRPGTLAVLPGTQGEWTQHAYVTGSEAAGFSPGNWVAATLTLVLLDGCWRHAHPYHFYPGTSSSLGDLDYPHDYPHDYAGAATDTLLDNQSPLPASFTLTVFGPAVGPAVTIGGNLYQLTTTLAAKEYATVDSQAKTITLTRADGSTTNIFATGVRGSGRDGGRYIFEPLPPGQSRLVWDASFGFDLVIWEEEGEPPWST